jgi:hypothetical protein
MRLISLSILCVLTLTVARLQAAPLEPADKATIVGKPVAIDVQPPTIKLDGPRATQQLLVTARYADGSLRDLTRFSNWVRPNLLTVSSTGLAAGIADGANQLDVSVGGRTARVPVVVTNSQTIKPISFRREFMPVLSAAGCSNIGCHGAPSGKDGFRLSLWGFDPDLDFRQLTHDGSGRRTNSVNPDNGLILLKALQRVPHVGGRRFLKDSTFATLVRTWQAEGLQDDSSAAKLKTLTVSPARRVLLAPAMSQQLSVLATFEDGSTTDVTQLTSFNTSDLAVAEVDRTGFVEFHRQGEVAILCRFQGRMESVRLMHIEEPDAEYKWSNPPESNFVDTHTFAKLKMLNIAPSDLCSDEQFVRRVYLDLCGILPTPSESQEFVAAKPKDKRAQLVDKLLDRPEYADYWTKKWLDVLRVSRDSIQLTGAQAYHAWLRERVEKDAPLTDIVQSLLTSKGASYSEPAVNFFCVAPTPKAVTDAHYLQKDLAEATSQLFLGIRLQCAKCHNHPYERWTQADYLSLAAFFTQVKRSRIGKAGPSGRPDRRQISVALDFKSAEIIDPTTQTAIIPRLFGSSQSNAQSKGDVGPQSDRREVLAQWLTKKDNPFFAKAIANRIWFHLNGRGIVEPVDDFRDSNPSANDDLLDALASDFVANGFRVKHLIRTIVKSRTYQLSALPNESNRSDQRYFSHMLARPLTAEVLLDAICDVTAVPERFEITKDYTIGVPDGTVKLPEGTRAVQLPVTDIVTLINTAGKYVRYELHPFLRTFGQPNRTQTCECDREQNFGRRQALELIIGQMLSSRLTRNDNYLGQMLEQKKSDAEILNGLYQRALSRSPSEKTRKALLAYVAKSTERRKAWEDVLWTVLNSQEFVYQH